MNLPIDDLPDWSFDADEVSMGVYRIRGKNNLGWTIDLTTTSEQDLIGEARKAAQAMVSRNAAKFSSTIPTKPSSM